MGLGWSNGKFRIDYVFVPLGVLGTAHRLSLGRHWGAPEDSLMPELVTSLEPEKAPVTPVEERFKRVDELMREGDYAGATRELQEASVLLPERDPRGVAYYERLGRVFLLQKDYRMARAGFERAIRAARELALSGNGVAEAYLGLGRLLLEQGSLDYARRFLQKALEVSPTEETRKAVDAAMAEVDRRRRIH